MPPQLSETPSEFQVKARMVGKRLDAYLASRFSDYSRSVIQKLIDAEAVLINGAPAKASYKVRLDDAVSIWLPDLGDGSITPEDLPLRIVYEDEALVVIDKGPGMVTHPARGNWTGTLANALQHHFDGLSTVAGALRPGIVHRLDRDTSGLILVAKDDHAHRLLAAHSRGGPFARSISPWSREPPTGTAITSKNRSASTPPAARRWPSGPWRKEARRR